MCFTVIDLIPKLCIRSFIDPKRSQEKKKKKKASSAEQVNEGMGVITVRFDLSVFSSDKISRKSCLSGKVVKRGRLCLWEQGRKQAQSAVGAAARLHICKAGKVPPDCFVISGSLKGWKTIKSRRI